MAAIFDYAGSLRRMGNDRSLFQEMVALLAEDAPQYQALIAESSGNHDYPTLKRAAHTLKGLVLNFGATRAVLAAVALENLAATAERDNQEEINFPAAMNELTAALDELQNALANHSDGAPIPESNLSRTTTHSQKH
ncbi:Hpt domain-containing protein [Anatilimnocola floriformis]|uniref:Hpt domain-containing protein n=1 Tax=Anatilimnocola floriformis TaxID=2948575 RepID=UPI0020C220E4|nr:Hpt domain-containing protein [Anatilimnocola floriformis]